MVLTRQLSPSSHGAAGEGEGGGEEAEGDGLA